MFKWCSYCQCYIGQREPYQNYSLTHGICDVCKKKFYQKDFKDDHVHNIQPLISFYEELRSKAFIGAPIDSQSLFLEAKILKIKPADLLAGMVQPLLYEIGSRYENGTLQVYEEHLFSDFTLNLINELKREYNLHLPFNSSPEVLLFLANNDHHEFGVRFLEVYLLQEGVKAKAILPSLPTDQILKLSQKLKPLVIGISITDPFEYDNLIDSLSIFKEWNETPSIIIGGQGITKREVQLPYVKIHQGNLNLFLEMIHTEIKRYKLKSA